MENIHKIITHFGNSGPIILFIYGSYLLWNKSTLNYYYQVGFFISAILNVILKGIFKCPRPSEDIREFNLALKNGRRFVFKNGIPHDIFGMPSGHSEATMFITTYIFLTLKNKKFALIFFLLSLLIMYQRIKDNHHTLLQVVVGATVGVVCAYLFYYFAQVSLTGKIKAKPDDNGPL
jgi:membrane-associated phospholipid phosphatase